MVMKNSLKKRSVTPAVNFKRTKIVVAIGPPTDSYAMVHDLIDAGANAITMNFSHQTYDAAERQTAWIRKVSHALKKPVAIVQDLAGPKIRLGDFEGFIGVETGQQICLGYETNYEKSGIIPVQYDLSTKVQRGHTIFLYDGKIKAIVNSVRAGIIYATVQNSGVLLKRKGINLPDTDFGGDVITDKDKADLAFGSTQDFDFVAMSFVQTADDLRAMRKVMNTLGYKAKLMAKVETKVAIENIEKIVQEADAVMVARGDLAYEVSPEAVPVLQRKIIGLCRQYGKLCVVATQMLGSMTENPEPTRAEVSDVATATLLQADALALRDETANGKYPIEAVQMMKRIITFTEQHSPIRKVHFNDEDMMVGSAVQQAIAKAIITLASRVGATAIVAETSSGGTALAIASQRPSKPIIVVTSSARVSQQLAIMYGSKTFVRKDEKMQATKLTSWLRKNEVLHAGEIIVTASGQYPGRIGTTDTIKVRVLE
jgi:pyruvate kinase